MGQFYEHGNEHPDSMKIGIVCVCYSNFSLGREGEEPVIGSYSRKQLRITAYLALEWNRINHST
jgi:hypothetical protein